MDIVRQSLAITLVFALLWAALWLLRRKGAIRPRLGKDRHEPQRLESRGRLALGAQHSLHLIRAGDREVVLAVHPAGVTVVCDLSAAAASQLSKPT
ncbi:MAG: flagellar biosynthetic protein FliO [Acidobacteriia bacterium]|nr:flagellar biosynthetic protein FliO [Terriglobia bacterium]